MLTHFKFEYEYKQYFLQRTLRCQIHGQVVGEFIEVSESPATTNISTSQYIWVMGLWYAFSKLTVMYCFQVQACIGMFNLRHPFPRHIKAMRPSITHVAPLPILRDLLNWVTIENKQTTEHMVVLTKGLDVLFDELVRLLY